MSAKQIALWAWAIAVAAAMLILAGCGGPSPAPGSSGPGAAEQSGTDNSALVKAGETAQAAVADSTVISIETEHNSARWEVQVVTADGSEHQVKVSPDGAKVVGGPHIKSETARDKAKHRNRVQAAGLDYRQALAAITAAVPGRVVELDLDSHDGATVWEADVMDSGNTKHEVRIDATSGDIVTNK